MKYVFLAESIGLLTLLLHSGAAGGVGFATGAIITMFLVGWASRS